MSLHIRTAKPAELDTICAIYARCKLGELRFEARPFQLLPLPLDPRRHKSLTEGELFVAEERGLILGFASRHGAEIRGLFVEPGQRGRGTGRALLLHLLNGMAGDARLCVANSNEPAIALYESLGFVRLREFETDYNGVPVMACEMQRQPTHGDALESAQCASKRRHAPAA